MPLLGLGQTNKLLKDIHAQNLLTPDQIIHHHGQQLQPFIKIHTRVPNQPPNLIHIRPQFKARVRQLNLIIPVLKIDEQLTEFLELPRHVPLKLRRRVADPEDIFGKGPRLALHFLLAHKRLDHFYVQGAFGGRSLELAFY